MYHPCLASKGPHAVKKTIFVMALSIACSASFAQIFGSPAVAESQKRPEEIPYSLQLQTAPTRVIEAPPAPTKRNGPPPATDFRSVAMACANTGKESIEAFNLCLKSSTISQPGVSQEIQNARLLSPKPPVYAEPQQQPRQQKPQNSGPVNLFAAPERN